MLEATIETLEEELELYGVEFKRVGLNPEHIEEYNLPYDPTAAKKTDSRYKNYVKKYGRVAVELDALHPSDLEELIRNAIENEVDMRQFTSQQEHEETERERLWQIRQKVMSFIRENVMFD